MTLLLILLIILVVLAVAGGPAVYRRPGRHRVVETVYRDDPVVEEIVEERPANPRPLI